MKLEQIKEKIKTELASSEVVQEFFRSAFMDDIVTLAVILKTLKISDAMSLNDYYTIKDCLDNLENDQ